MWVDIWFKKGVGIISPAPFRSMETKKKWNEMKWNESPALSNIHASWRRGNI